MDPSFGEGVFLRAACRRISRLGGNLSNQLSGIEIDQRAFDMVLEALRLEFGLIDAELLCRNFFEVPPGFRRVTAIVGNPPFIRYQTFKGYERRLALRRASEQGIRLSELSSSWAPFLVHSISMIDEGGRLAMVLPFELSHASYARPLLGHLAAAFGKVTMLTFQHKLFPELNEETMLLLAEDRGSHSTEFRLQELSHPRQLADFAAVGRIGSDQATYDLDHEALCSGEKRLIQYFLPDEMQRLYELVSDLPNVRRLGDISSVGIGYVTGANDYFHLSPSDVQRWRIPKKFLKRALRKGRRLTGLRFRSEDWREGLASKETGYLLHIEGRPKLPDEVLRYLAEGVRSGIPRAYKCRKRSPWYQVPHVHSSDAFLTYMSGSRPRLVANDAHAFASNNLHLVRIHAGCGLSGSRLAALWQTSMTSLSAELHGHSLGGGLLKMEPSEARNVLMPIIDGPDILDIERDIDESCRKLDAKDLRHRANKRILMDHLGLSDSDCELLEAGAQMLTNRRSRRARKGNHAS